MAKKVKPAAKKVKPGTKKTAPAKKAKPAAKKAKPAAKKKGTAVRRAKPKVAKGLSPVALTTTDVITILEPENCSGDPLGAGDVVDYNFPEDPDTSGFLNVRAGVANGSLLATQTYAMVYSQKYTSVGQVPDRIPDPMGHPETVQGFPETGGEYWNFANVPVRNHSATGAENTLVVWSLFETDASSCWYRASVWFLARDGGCP